MKNEEGILSSVKKIVDVYIAANGTKYFRIQWKDTWEPELHLISCEELLEQFYKEIKDSSKLKFKQEKTSTITIQSGDKSAVDTATTFCNCGTLSSNGFKKKSFEDKGTQHYDILQKSESGVQVNSYYRKTRNRSVQVVCAVAEMGVQVNSKCKMIDKTVQFVSGIITKTASVQVSANNHESRNIETQAGSGFFTLVESGIQANRRIKNKNRKTQAGPGFHIQCESSVQVNTYHQEKEEKAVQFTPNTKESETQSECLTQSTQFSLKIADCGTQASQCTTLDTVECGVQAVEDTSNTVKCGTQTVECGTQNVVVYKDQQCQYNDGYDALQIFADTEDIAIQNTVTYKDQDSQYENSFTEYGDGAIFQKEVAMQCSPRNSHCGIQTPTVYCNDQFTQCDENVFQREIGCQFNPKTVSCGVQKDIPGLDKYSQYEVELALNSLCVDTPKKVKPKVIRYTPCKATATKYDRQRNLNDTQMHLAKGNMKLHQRSAEVQSKNSSSNIVSSPCTQMLKDPTIATCRTVKDAEHGISTSFQTVDDGGQRCGKEIEDQDLDFCSTTVHGIEEKKEDRMKEMIIVTNMPLDLQQENDHEKVSHKHDNVDVATSAISNAMYHNSPICIMFTPDEKPPRTSTPQNLLFQSSHGCVTDQNVLISGATGDVFHAKSEVHTNVSSAEQQIICNSHKRNLTLQPPFNNISFQSKDENMIGQISSIKTDSLQEEVTGNNSISAAAMASLDESTPLREGISSLNHSSIEAKPVIYEKTQCTPVSSPVLKKPLEVSDASEIACSNYHSPDHVPKKGSRDKSTTKRKRRHEKNKDGSSEKRKSKKKILLEDKLSCDVHPVLPVYDTMPVCEKEVEEDHSEEGIYGPDDDVDTDISKFVNNSEIPTSDANGINDDFISKYWN